MQLFNFIGDQMGTGAFLFNYAAHVPTSHENEKVTSS